VPVLLETTDAAASTATSYTMAAGDYFFGSLSIGTEHDWVEVSLQAGQTYTFALVGVGALDDAATDTYLRLRSASGTLIDEDDDSGPGRNSTITFTASSTGTYYLDASSFVGSFLTSGDSGDYGLSMVTGNRASYDVIMGAGALMRPGVSWAAASGTPVTVTWGIRDTGPAQDADGNTVAFIGLTAAQIAAVTSVMGYYDGISGLSFSQVNPGGSTNSATMLFGAYNSTTDGAGAFASYPGSTAFTAEEGDVWLNNNSVSQTSLPTGSYSFFTLLHETGHAVGLAHPGDYNAAPGLSITYGADAQFTQDSHQYTMMSYFDESNTTGSFGSYPDTLMLYDIYALHQLYGADMTFHAENTTYGFNATVSGAYDFSTNTDPFLSIWDGGGTDTLDLSGYGMAQSADLREGMFSDIGGYSGNLSIAIGAVIENAIGGSGADEITGNSANNVLKGGLGDDRLTGNTGRDVLWGEGGNDSMFGGNHDDILRGGSYQDQLFGGGGNDRMYGDAGFDLMVGGTGHDIMFGGFQHDTLYGRDGNDTMRGDGGNDLLFGEGGNDRLEGNGGTDSMLGGLGSDTLIGGGQDDTLRGEAGVDVLRGSWQNDWLYGGAEGDSLFGDAHNDHLFGEDGDDTLRGGSGFDTLDGGTDDDEMSGGSGSDQFVFVDGFGDDVITDFDALDTLEKIDLAAVTSITSYANLMDPAENHIAQVGSDVVIDDGSGNTITLLGVSLGDLDSTDFLF